MTEKLYVYRFELFLFTLLSILFGELIVPINWFESWMMPILILCNICSGVLLVRKNKRLLKIVFAFLLVSLIIAIMSFVTSEIHNRFNYLKLASYFVFYGVVTIEIISQVWKTKNVGKNVILGLISGYISLGLLSFFLCLTIEIIYPNSFILLASNHVANSETTGQLMYYAYITLMTIGYGDIIPVTEIAQKAAVFIGLCGQFYLVILTAIVVGKYINQTSAK